jgi:hypothetical protein
VQRPGLARKVRQLLLQPGNRNVYINSCFNQISGGMLPTYLRRRTTFMEEIEVVGHISSSLSNLKSLRLDLFSKKITQEDLDGNAFSGSCCVTSLALRYGRVWVGAVFLLSGDFRI